jgi:hypothetical protein
MVKEVVFPVGMHIEIEVIVVSLHRLKVGMKPSFLGVQVAHIVWVRRS